MSLFNTILGVGGGLYPGSSLYGNIFVFGGNGIILSINTNFIAQQITSPVSDNYADAWFSSRDVGYAVTTNGKVVKTIDAGLNWNLISTITNPYDIRAIYAIDDNTVVVGGKSASTGTMIWRSTDGGSSWSTAMSNASTNPVECFSFVNTTSGFCVDTGRLLKTVDGGASWSVVNTAPSGIFFDEISMATNLIGFVGCEGSTFSAFKTTNGGSALSSISGIGGDVVGIDAISPTYAFMCRNNGIVYKTTNGTSWTSQQVASTASTLNCIHFSRENMANGVVCGDNSSVYITNDSGSTWTQVGNAVGSFTSAFIRNL